MEISRVFEKSTRTISCSTKKYSGQAFDNQSATLHFTLLDEGRDWDPVANGYTPYIMFNIYDEAGNPIVFGPDSSPLFDGYTFKIPWAITSRMKSARLEYQLFFIKTGIPFDGVIDGMDSTEYLLSAVDGIALKPSITKCRDPCAPDRAFAPVTEPSVLGWVQFWKQHGVMLPVDVKGKMYNGLPGYGYELTFHSYTGQVQVIDIDTPTLDEDGKIGYALLPVGNEANHIPLIKQPAGDGQALIFDAALKGFRGSRIPMDLNYRPTVTNNDGEIIKRHILELRDAKRNVISEVDLPIENLIIGASYDKTKKAIVFQFEDPNLNLAIPIDDFVQMYKGAPGQINVSTERKYDAVNEEYYFEVSLAPEFVSGLNTKFDTAASNLNEHKLDYNNPHHVTKAQVGLGNVDNTSDMNKPVSTAQRAAIEEAKQIAATYKEEVDTTNAAQQTLIEGLRNDLTALDTRENAATLAIEGKVSNMYTKDAVNKLVNAKQDKLTPGDHVTLVNNVIGVDLSGLDVKADDHINGSSTNAVQNQAVAKALELKQDKLTPGDNIVINGNRISATQPRIDVDGAMSATSENPVMNKTITQALEAKADVGSAGVFEWSEGLAIKGHYNSRDVVMYDYSLYVSIVDNNVHHPLYHDDDTYYWRKLASDVATNVQGITPATFIGVFGNDTDTEYTITHNMGSRNLVYSIITNNSDHMFVNATVSAPTLSTFKVKLTSPPGLNRLMINIIKAKTVAPRPTTAYPTTIEFLTPTANWEFYNDSGKPVYAKAYDSEGNDLNGDIIQDSGDGFSTVFMGFSEPQKGKMFVDEADHVQEITIPAGETVDIAPGDGKWHLVQCFRDGEGQSRLDIVQTQEKITIGANVSWNGYVALFDAVKSERVTASKFHAETDGTYSFTYKHSLGRVVGAQFYADNEGMGIIDMHCIDENTIKLFFNSNVAGELVVI